MRARRSTLTGGLVLAAYAGLVGYAAVTAVTDDPEVDRSVVTADPAEELVEAWERSRKATFVTEGTYERSSDVTGSAIASEDYVAQLPPRRVHRQLGGVEGRDDDRLLVCPAPPEGEDEAPCRLGQPGGRTYAESVAREVEGIRSLVIGSQRLYSVVRGEPGCFDLELLRVDPRAPFGIEASFCFDAATGAPSGNRVRHEGGIVEVVVVTAIRTDVTDEDLEPLGA